MVKLIPVLIVILAVFVLGLLFYPNFLYSPSTITFSDGSSYEQEYIDQFFEISDKDYELSKEKWASEIIGDGGFSSSDCNQDPQGPPTGSKPIPPKPGDKLPPGYKPGMPEDSCFWHALLLAKQQKFGEQFTYGDLLKLLDEAKKQGVYQNPALGGRGTVTPTGSVPEDKVKDLMERINYLDNFALEIGKGGAGGPGAPGSKDTLLIIKPGTLGDPLNKAMIKQASDAGHGVVLNFRCVSTSSGGVTPGGHATNVPMGGITPNPSCTSIKFKTQNPNGEVEVDSDGQVTGSSAPGVPLDCLPGSTGQLSSILIIEHTPAGTPVPQAPSGSFTP